jgi:hypothetical protein
MDKEAESRKLQLENEKQEIENYLNHPVSKRIFADNASEQEGLIKLVLDLPVINIETFLAREQALGHLRGLRRGESLVRDSLEDIKEELKSI